jgi:hypothetical protein
VGFPLDIAGRGIPVAEAPIVDPAGPTAEAGILVILAFSYASEIGCAAGMFDLLIAALDARISAFPADFIEYIVDILTTTSNDEYPWTSNAHIRSFFRSRQLDTHSEIS